MNIYVPVLIISIIVVSIVVSSLHLQNITKFIIRSKDRHSKWKNITFEIKYFDRTNQFLVVYTIKYREKNARDYDSGFIIEAFTGTTYFSAVDETCKELFGTYNIADRLAVLLKYKMMQLKPD